ncbi:hypothetical protein [Bacillus cereus group sp. BfR-BA-01328]|uniref:hypothetical protein n=1 Tax=Bacillus cereus group sp. BfR-BA-01328 TaxID=2920304 RepID=UPI001F5618F0
MKCRVCNVDESEFLSELCKQCSYLLSMGYTEEDVKKVRSGTYKVTDYDYFVSYSYVKDNSHGFDNDLINIFEHPSEKGILWIKEVQTRIKNKYEYDDVKIISFQGFVNNK